MSLPSSSPRRAPNFSAFSTPLPSLPLSASKSASSSSVPQYHFLCCSSTRPPVCSNPISRRAVLPLLPLALLASFHRTANADSDTQPDAKSDTQPVSDIDPLTNEPTITDHVYIDVAIASGPSLRFVIGLYGDLMPNVVRNFKLLCADGYADTAVYRIVPGLTVQMGDVLRNNGKSGRPAIGDGVPFSPDGFRVSHTGPGIVSMVRRPDGLVDSRFFVATRDGDSLYLDGKYAAFGRVVEGLDVFRLLERAGGGVVRKPVRIVACGNL